MTEARTGPATVSPRIVLAVVSFGVFIAADDLTVVATMLRQIIGDLDITLPDGFDETAWIVNAYLVAYVAVMPFMGRVSDIFGRRKVFLWSLAVFLAGSIWIPFTTSLGPFIAGRILTAVGGGAMVPVAIAAVADVYEEQRRPTALGVLGAIDTLGWVWGPLFGAMLVRFLSWRWQFYLNIPLAVIGMAAAWYALRDLDRPARRARIDWGGAVSLAAGLVLLNIALLDSSDIQSVASLEELTGAGSRSVLPLYAGAVVALVAFILVERRSRDPLVDLSLFSDRNLSAGIVINFLVGAVLIIAMVDVPLFVNVTESDVGRAAIESGWVLSALTATMAVAAYAGGRATERTWYRPVTVVGMAAVGTGFLIMGLTWSESTEPGTMAAQLVVLGLGFGLVTAPTNAAVVDAVPPDRRGTAAGLVLLFRLLGLSVGLSGLTAWGLYRFDQLRQQLELPPIGDPGFEAALETAQAETTAMALAETFLFAAVLSVIALGVAWSLRRSGRGANPGAGRSGGP